MKGHPVRVTYNGEKMKLSGQYFIAEKQGVTFYVIPSSFAERMKDNCRFCKKSNTDTDTTVILNEDYGILVD
ncbi:MAG: hypothetical protein PF488_00460 [Patescibacteria group bacterium]|nr:hypothetical protein [Patescibacteria group bacterium]